MMRLGVPSLLVVVLGVWTGVIMHNSALIVGALITLGVVVAIAGVEIPLILGFQRRRAAARLNSSPPGITFAETATLMVVRAGPPTGSAARMPSPNRAADPDRCC